MKFSKRISQGNYMPASKLPMIDQETNWDHVSVSAATLFQTWLFDGTSLVIQTPAHHLHTNGLERIIIGLCQSNSCLKPRATHQRTGSVIQWVKWESAIIRINRQCYSRWFSYCYPKNSFRENLENKTAPSISITEDWHCFAWIRSEHQQQINRDWGGRMVV